MGADDFIRKPFSQRLLVERVKAVLTPRRPQGPALPKETTPPKCWSAGLFAHGSRTPPAPGRPTVTLTVTEFLILQALATRPGVVKSRNALMDALRRPSLRRRSHDR